MRKFLQSVYSGDDSNGSPFGHLTPEVQRARNNLAESRTDRRQQQQHHHHTSRHAATNDAPIIRGIRGDDQRYLERAAIHHLASRSDPQFRHQQPFPSSMLTSSNVDAAGVSTSSRRPITAESMHLDNRGSRRWEAEAMDEDERDWREDEDDDIAQNDHAARTPTASFPPASFSFGSTSDQRTSRVGPMFVDANSTFSSSSAPRSDRPSFGSTAFSGAGRTLGEIPGTHQLGGAVNLTSLATPPLTTAEGFFRGPASAFIPRDSHQRQMPLFPSNNEATSSPSRHILYSSVIRDQQVRTMPGSLLDQQTPRSDETTSRSTVPPSHLPHTSSATSSSSSSST